MNMKDIRLLQTDSYEDIETKDHINGNISNLMLARGSSSADLSGTVNNRINYEAWNDGPIKVSIKQRESIESKDRN